MKKTISILLCALLVMGVLAGCQKTPESPIVVQKNLDKLVENFGQNGMEDDSQSLATRLDVPEKLQMQLESKGGKLKINVDAFITLPDTNQMPMIRVGHAQFNEQDARRYADVLLKDAMPLDPFHTPQTKAQIQKSIASLQALKQRGELDKYESIEEIDAAIAKLMAEAIDAPDTFTPSEHVFNWPSPDEPPLSLRAASDSATVSDLYVGYESIEYCKNLDYSATMSAILVGIPPSDAIITRQKDLSRETGYTPEEAYTLALETISQLQIDNMICSGRRGFTFHQAEFSVYEFLFTREISGIPLTYTNDIGNQFAPNAVAKTWSYEKVRLFIDDTGVSYLLYNSPYEILETVSEEVNMLSFPEIQNIFERMAPVVNNFYDEYGRECEMNIHEVKLGLMRITERNSKETGLIIPVWDFMGTYTYQEDLSGQMDTTMDDPYISILTINAIDGSIIDRALGY